MARAQHRTLIAEIPKEKRDKRGWEMRFTGDVHFGQMTVHLVDAVLDPAYVELHHPSYGTWAYGMTPPGYDGWSYRGVGGGGSIIIPYFRARESLYVGVVEQERHNQKGGTVWNVPRGFLNPGETHFQAASRELQEEMDLEGAIETLPGQPGNPDSAYFETVAQGEGVHYYAMRVPENALEWKCPYFVFREGALTARSSKQKMAELILQSRFIPWEEAADFADQFTGVALLRLIRKRGIRV